MNEIVNLGNGMFVKITMLKGQQGSDIQNIAKTSTNVLVDTYTITLTDGSTHTFTVTNGKGIVSIAKTDTTGLVDTYTITFNDNTTQTFTVTNGKSITTIEKTTTQGLVDTYTITFNDGTTTTFDVTNGADGSDGVGISSIAKTSTSGLVDTYTITLTNGQTSTFDVTNGANGQDVSQSNLASVETGNTASTSYAVDSHLVWNGVYYKVIQAIASGGAFNVGVNLESETINEQIENQEKLLFTLTQPSSGNTWQTFLYGIALNNNYNKYFSKITKAILYDGDNVYTYYKRLHNGNDRLILVGGSVTSSSCNINSIVFRRTIESENTYILYSWTSSGNISVYNRSGTSPSGYFTKIEFYGKE